MSMSARCMPNASLLKLASSRFGCPASKTLDVAQELYDGEGKKILTYPRAEVCYLPESAIADEATIVARLKAGRSCASVLVPSPPVIRKGRGGTFHDKGIEGASHHADISTEMLPISRPRSKSVIAMPPPKLLAKARSQPAKSDSLEVWGTDTAQDPSAGAGWRASAPGDCVV